MPPTRKRPRVICMGWKAPSTAGSFSTTSIVEKIRVARAYILGVTVFLVML